MVRGARTHPLIECVVFRVVEDADELCKLCTFMCDGRSGGRVYAVVGS